MDLSLLIVNNTAECVIFDPRSGKNTDIAITVYATHTAESKAARAKLTDVTDANIANYLADVTVSWKNVELNGKALDCNRENALAIYNHTGRIVAAQITTFMGADANFLPKR